MWLRTFYFFLFVCHFQFELGPKYSPDFNQEVLIRFSQTLTTEVSDEKAPIRGAFVRVLWVVLEGADNTIFPSLLIV